MLPAQNETYHNFIVKYNQNRNGPIEYLTDGTFQVINDFYAVVYVPESLAGDTELNSYSYNSIPKCYVPMDLEAAESSGVNYVYDQPYLKLRGKGTLIAVIDSGIDYTNPLFSYGDTSRILALWDQTIEEDSTETVPYGKVFWKEDIDRALRTEDPFRVIPSMDENGHGTMMASLAGGGRDLKENFTGMAPEAALLIVKVKPAKQYLKKFYLYPEDAELYQEDDLMLGISFALTCARRFQMPLSICLGIGSSQGAHLGKSPLCQYLNLAAGFPETAVSVPAGNEGMQAHHYTGFPAQNRGKEIVELKIGQEKKGFSMELWADPLEKGLFYLESPVGERLGISTSLRAKTQELRFVSTDNKVLVNYIEIERLTGKTLVYFRFYRPAEGIWKLEIQTDRENAGDFDLWLPVQKLISAETYFLRPSPEHTITSPGDAEEVMTMTAYNAWDHRLYQQAGRGYLPDGTIKPDFAEPGVGVLVPVPDGGFGRASGTSLSAAQNAGIAALFLEWSVVRENEPYFSGNNVKMYLQRGADTISGKSYPNPEWGYGRTSLYRSFSLLR